MAIGFCEKSIIKEEWRERVYRIRIFVCNMKERKYHVNNNLIINMCYQIQYISAITYNNKKVRICLACCCIYSLLHCVQAFVATCE